MGDYNIGLWNSESLVRTNEFVDLMNCNEFIPLISRPTRITSTSATIIDHIFKNNNDDLNHGLTLRKLSRDIGSQIFSPNLKMMTVTDDQNYIRVI